jgi:hypothetical protein
MLSLLTKEQWSRIQHVSVDMTSSAEDIAKALREANVAADYISYNAYLSPKSGKSAMNPSTAEKLVEADVPPFKNFLSSLPIAGIKPKRILLQTGGKTTACTLAVYARRSSSQILSLGIWDQTSIILKKTHSAPFVTSMLKRTGTLFAFSPLLVLLNMLNEHFCQFWCLYRHSSSQRITEVWSWL